jgi:uncharacterized membrane protein (Fun14 family)
VTFWTKTPDLTATQIQVHLHLGVHQGAVAGWAVSLAVWVVLIILTVFFQQIMMDT